GTFYGVFLDPLEFGFLMTVAIGYPKGDPVLNVFGRAVTGRLVHIGVGGHIGDLGLDGPKVDDRGLELDSFIGIFGGLVEYPALGLQTGRGQFYPPHVQGVHGDLEAIAPFREHILNGYLGLVEENLSGGGRMDAQFVFLISHGDPIVRVIFRNDTGDVFIVLDPGKDNEHIAETRIGDPHFLSTDAVIFPIFGEDRLGLARIGIGASAWFGQAIGPEPFPTGQFWHIFLFLSLTAVQGDG